MENKRHILRIGKLAQQGSETDLTHTTPEERLSMMWQLALDAWAFKGEPVVEPQLSRHIVNILRKQS